MRFASILILSTLLPLLTFGIGPSLTTQHLELITTKLSNQDITITPTGTGDVVLKDYDGVLKASSGVLSASDVNLASEVTGILGIVNGGVPEPGTDGQILTLDVGIPKWLNPPVSTTLDTKGQIQGYSTENASIGPCTDDQILVYDAVEATGWKCSALPSSSPTTTQGDLILRGAANDERLPIGVAGKILTSDGTSASWDDAPAGAAKIWNIIDDSSFEKGTYGTCSSAGSAVTSCAAIDRTTQIKPIDKKIFKIDADVSDTLTWTHNIISSDYTNTQMLAGCQVSADAATSDVTIKALVDSVEQWSQDVPSDGVERDYYFPTIGGVTDFDIVVSGTAGAGDKIKIDNCYQGRIPIGYIQDVSQAHFVGSVHFNDADCTWSRTSATYGTMTTTGCTSDTPVGNITVPTPNTASITIPNARTDGTYHVETQGLLFNQGDAGTCRFSLSTSSSYEDQGDVYASPASTGNRADNFLTGDFKFSSSGDKSINIIARGSSGTECRAFGSGDNLRKWSVHFFPDSTNSIVQQEKELTAKTANMLSARISNAGTASIVSSDYDFIESVTTSATGKVDIVYKSGIFSVVPSVTPGVEDNNNVISVINETVSGFTVFTETSDGTDANRDFSVHISKQDSDVNKSIKVEGHFLASQIKGHNSCYIKDVKPSGTAGGTSVVGDQFRDLNVINEDGSTTSSSCPWATLASNEITLEPGGYVYACSAPAFTVDRHRLKLYNTTNSTVENAGTSGYSLSSAQTMSIVQGKISLTEAQSFKLQQYMALAKGTNGFGVNTGDGSPEIYTSCVFEKIK